MAQPEIQQFKLIPGGIFPDVPENQAFFLQLRATPALSTKDLLKLAIFTHGSSTYKTNRPLSVSLFSAAVQRFTRSPQLKKALTTQGDTIVDGASLKEVAKLVIDLLSQYSDSFIPSAGIHWIPVTTLIPGLGLLVGTPQDINNVVFLIGICPAPTSLPD